MHDANFRQRSPAAFTSCATETYMLNAVASRKTDGMITRYNMQHAIGYQSPLLDLVPSLCFSVRIELVPLTSESPVFCGLDSS